MYNCVYNIAMLFKKRISNIKKLGIDFTRAAEIFVGPTFTWEDSRFGYGEQRWITMGLYGSLVVVLVAHTETEEDMSSQSEKQIKTNRRSSSAISDDAPKVTQAMLDNARFRVGLKDAPRKQRVNIMLDTAQIKKNIPRAGGST